jgi:pimeloyl-ACP methyl ester carboxylesterase
VSESVVVVGGALRTPRDYQPLAAALADRFAVHILERRGGPMDVEVADLVKAVEETGARKVFGHSFGGLVAMEAARVEPRIEELALYEPAISVGGSIPTGWIEPYAELLAGGDRRGAFAEFVRGSGQAPAVLRKLPLWYVKLVLRVAVRGEEWRSMEPLLEANLREHQEVRRLDGVARYEQLDARVLLMLGEKSPPETARGSRELRLARPPQLQTVPRVGHLAPDREAPDVVARLVAAFFDSDQPTRRDTGAGPNGFPP